MDRLFVLPFDHRSTFTTSLFGFEYPLKTLAQKKAVKDMKKVVFDAFVLAHNQYKNSEDMAILVDEEFGSSIIKDAQNNMIQLIVSVERSGQLFFQFEHGNNFGIHLKHLKPTYAKALIRYDASQKIGNEIQNKRLKRFNDFCAQNDIKWMLEPLMTGNGDKFRQIKITVQQMKSYGINPDIWKVEGLKNIKQWKELYKLTNTDLIVLGRGESKKMVESWIKTAASSGVVKGFAIGRTVFFDVLEDLRDKKITRSQAVQKIANNYLHFIRLFEKYED
jgi:myo-inositol catabolism protein IolC